MKFLQAKCVASVFYILIISGCKSFHHTNTHVSEKKVLDNYYVLVLELYDQCFLTVKELNKTIDTFNQNVNQQHFRAVKNQWKKSKQCYSMAEATRFAGTYIDEIDTLINAWPIDELYIDYVDSNPRSGIIANNNIEINFDSLLHLNEKQGETNIAIGYHAIEFLLWGQDFNTSGPGQRHWTDYSTAPNAIRRKNYLAMTGLLLQQHMNELTNSWQQQIKNTLNLNQTITGLGTFMKAELVGERMQVALDTYDQEDEQSCFSDFTAQDIIYNIKGVLGVLEGQMVLNGHTLGNKKLSIIDLLASNNASLSQSIKGDIKKALNLMEQLTLPFDQAILPSNPIQRKIIEDVAKLMSGVANKIRMVQHEIYVD